MVQHMVVSQNRGIFHQPSFVREQELGDLQADHERQRAEIEEMAFCSLAENTGVVYGRWSKYL